MFARQPSRIWRVACALVACIGLLLTCGCEAKKPSGTASTSPPAMRQALIYTTFYPTTYFTQRIGGELVEVVCPCPASADPAFWMPEDATIEAYQKADLIVVNGASFEKWLQKASLPPSRLVDTAKPFEGEFIVLKEAITHTHGPAGKHSHEGIDGHTWLDPVNAKVQAGEIKAALVKRFPAHKEVFGKNYAELVKDLEALSGRLQALAEKLTGQQLLASHPAYNYVGRRYGWELKNFHLDPEAMPDEDTFAQIKKFIEDHPAKYMLWEAEPIPEIAEKFRAELGLESIVFSPCETLEADELEAGVDFLAVMTGNVDRMEQALAD